MTRGDPRKMRLRRFAGIVLLTACFAGSSAACEMTPIATVPLALLDGRFLVDVVVNALPATFQLDTGAVRSVVTPDAVRRLGLARDRWVASTVEGIGGIDRRSVADPASLTLGGIALHHRDASGDAMLAVAPLGAPRAGGRTIDGLLGRDFLSAFDVAIDGPARTLALWRVRGCAGRFVPWTGAYDAIPAIPAYGEALVLAVLANGKPLRALPDTGATESVLTAPGMARLGLAESGRSLRARGVGSRARPVSALRLSQLRVGEETSHDVAVLATGLRVVPIVGMLLGADWFATRRVWLSYATRQVFVRPAH